MGIHPLTAGPDGDSKKPAGWIRLQELHLAFHLGKPGLRELLVLCSLQVAIGGTGPKISAVWGSQSRVALKKEDEWQRREVAICRF